MNTNILLRNSVAAFLSNNGKYLLMKRSESRAYIPGYWSGVGGHMEPQEINDPQSACYREIEEETGIGKTEIPSLDLLYIIIRRGKDEIRQSYIYFGETSKTEVIQTDEDSLFWIDEKEFLAREYTKTFAAMLEHYTKRLRDDRAVYVGAAENDNGRLRMNWSRCEDYER